MAAHSDEAQSPKIHASFAARPQRSNGSNDRNFGRYFIISSSEFAKGSLQPGPEQWAIPGGPMATSRSFSNNSASLVSAGLILREKQSDRLVSKQKLRQAEAVRLVRVNRESGTQIL